MLSGAVSHISVIMALIFYALSSGFFLHAFPQIKKRIKEIDKNNSNKQLIFMR